MVGFPRGRPRPGGVGQLVPGHTVRCVCWGGLPAPRPPCPPHCPPMPLKQYFLRSYGPGCLGSSQALPVGPFEFRLLLCLACCRPPSESSCPVARTSPAGPHGLVCVGPSCARLRIVTAPGGGSGTACGDWRITPMRKSQADPVDRCPCSRPALRPLQGESGHAVRLRSLQKVASERYLLFPFLLESSAPGGFVLCLRICVLSLKVLP